MVEIPRYESIQIVGSGNIAYHLAQRLASRELYQSIRIVSRNESMRETFQHISNKIDFNSNENFNFDIPATIIAVSDDAIATVAAQYVNYNHLILHTAGSVDTDFLYKIGFQNFGSLYPLQTFSMRKAVDWNKIPVFISANSEENSKKTSIIALNLSEKIHYIDDRQRLALHIAAVIANNFSNHLFAEAEHWLDIHNLKFEFILPLIQETIEKLQYLSPFDAQTGPAIRNDQKVIDKHIKELSTQPDLSDLYQLLSHSIQKIHNK